MHFWLLATRECSGRAVPRKIGLNWFIPALVNMSVGSSCGTTGDDGTNTCPFAAKKSRNCCRICREVILKTPKKSQRPPETPPNFRRILYLSGVGLATLILSGVSVYAASYLAVFS